MIIAFIIAFTLGILSIVGANAARVYRETRFKGIGDTPVFDWDRHDYSEADHRMNAYLSSLSVGGYLSGVLELIVSFIFLILGLTGGMS